ncbi:MAG TPA: hypothetical protein VFE98_04405 [Candidatus Bathyarchaeia archaeon]|nr:hypothetical protein [Candidatus Bathyarchaeia archaeon]
MYYPKRTPQQKLGTILIILGVLLLLAYGLGLLFLIPGILLYYYGRERCQYCKVRGKIRAGRSDLVSQQRGFGLVTRTEVAQGRVGRRVQQSTITRQERVPVVNTTTRVDYVCTNCQHVIGSRDYYNQREDFSPPEQTVVQREIEREVLRIPCKYCRTLLDPIREKNCPNCGAVVTT